MAPTISNPLPSPRHDQKHVTVSPIAGGFFTLQDIRFIHPADPDSIRTVPSLTFLITHAGTSAYGADPGNPFHLMFDLGLRKAQDRYPEVLQGRLNDLKPMDLAPGVAAQLKAGGLDASDVDLVLLSHVHYDHHGDPGDFPNARFLIGSGAMDVLKHGLGPAAAGHQFFEPDTLPDDRTSELSDPSGQQWEPLGPFPAALDLFQDGSVYVIDSPGHLPGHVNLLCRTEDRFILLCGDSYHDRRLLTGERAIATWDGPHGEMMCIHVDKESAAESIRRLREFDQATGDQCELIAAHEEIWWEEHKDRAFPRTL